MYMKKTDMLYRSRTCAKCGAHVPGQNDPVKSNENGLCIDGGGSNRIPLNNHGGNLELGGNYGTPISIRSERQLSTNRSEQITKMINYQLSAKSQPNIHNKELDSIVIYHGVIDPIEENNGNNTGQISSTNITTNLIKKNNSNNSQQNNLNQSKCDDRQLSFENSAAVGGVGSGAGGGGGLTDNFLDFFESQFKNQSKTSFMSNRSEITCNLDEDDDDEPAPYATFNLPGFGSDSKISDSYETFAAKFSEPPYTLLQKGIECPPQYADSIDSKIRYLEQRNMNELVDRSTANSDQLYQSASGLSQYHSIASCSSNQDELIRAYEFGKEQKQKLLKLQNQIIQQLANEGCDSDQAIYSRSLQSDHESPTDPGFFLSRDTNFIINHYF